MKAVWYEEFGTASEVLKVGEMADPVAGPGEVLVRVKATGVNPSDVKRRAGARPGAVMDFAQVIPHSDGSGVIKAVGEGVDPTRTGQRVWLWNAAWQRAFGSAAELIALPAEKAVPMPEEISFEDAACFGIPAMTAWYALFANGPIEEKTVLVTGGAGAVGRYACQMAKLGGARVITTVSSAEKGAHSTAQDWINYREGNASAAVMDLTNGAGVDLIVDVDFAANQPLAVDVLKPSGTIAAYASASEMVPSLQFYPLMFRNITMRMLIAYLIDPKTHRAGEAQLAQWSIEGALSHAPVVMQGLDNMANAHDLVASGDKLGTVVVSL
jgi:NADPH2:quinone reductase